jgi:hypothetical protein
MCVWRTDNAPKTARETILSGALFFFLFFSFFFFIRSQSQMERWFKDLATGHQQQVVTFPVTAVNILRV